MANEPTINLALVGEMPENPVRGTIYMSPDTSGNFVKVGVDGSVRTIFDGSIYALRKDLPWTFGEGENSAILKDTDSYATGTGAVAHGYDTSAHGDYSHAEGYYTDASGNYSHAEGIHAKASGRYSHAEGSGTIASGEYSHAEGDSASAIGDYSHAEGDSTIAYGSHSHVEGYGSSESLSFTISGAANATTYTTNVAHELKIDDILEYEGIIARVTAISTTKKFTVDHTLSDVQLTNISGLKKISGISYGVYSHAEGRSCTASGDYSHAEGNSTKASGQYSHAEGRSCTASGDYSHAEGNSTKASGQYSHAEGGITIASGDYSHAEGHATKASSQYSHAEGKQATASGGWSHAEGNSATASGVCSHAEGNSTKASGQYSHAEGSGTIASGEYSHAEGDSATASASYSHAEGGSTTASGDYSHAEGYQTSASGQYSHAEGYQTSASGAGSHAEGCYTITTNRYEHAQGIYNYSNGNTLFSIGIGYDINSRKNIIEVNSKKLYINKVGGYEGTTIDSSTNALDAVLNMPGFSDPEYDYIFNGGTIPEPSRPPRPVVVPDDIHNYWIYVDSYKSAMAELAEDQGYDSIQSYMDAFFEDPDNTMSLGYRFEYSEDITFDGSTYQLWYSDWGSETYAILKNDSLQTMIDNSKETELDNEYTPFISILDSDMNTIYDKGQMSDFWKIYKHSLVLVRPVDSVTSDIRDYYLYTNDLGDESGFLRWTEKCGYDDIDSYLDDLLDNPEQFYTNAYYYDSDIEFDGETYQLWRDWNTDEMPMLLKSDTPEYMAMHSVEADYHNKYCPFVAMLNNDMDDIRYDDNNINMAEKYRLLCFRER